MSHIHPIHHTVTQHTLPLKKSPAQISQRVPARHSLLKGAGSLHSLPNLRFGKSWVKAPIENVHLITDFNDASSNAEAISRYRDVLKFTDTRGQELQPFKRWNRAPKEAPDTSLIGQIKAILKTVLNAILGVFSTPKKADTIPVHSLSDIPFGNTDYAALTLQRIATSRPNKDIVVLVCDPGVGNGETRKKKITHDRSILITENYGLVIGPNNGIFSLAIKSLEEKGERYKLLPIDLEKVQQLERIRLKNPSYTLPETFHGRDVFMVAAAAIANGIAPEALCDEKRARKFTPKITPFAQSIVSLPLKASDKGTEFYGVQDRTFGNIKTNLILNAKQAEKLLAQDAVFEIRSADPTDPITPLQLPLKKFFAQVPKKDPVLYLGSTYSPKPDKRFVEIALNFDNASARLGLNPLESKKLVIQRIR